MSSSVEEIRQLYEAEHEQLFRAIVGSFMDRQIADDAVAEAFAQLLRRGGDVEQPRAWVWKSAFAIARGLKTKQSEAGELPESLPEVPRPVAAEMALREALGKLEERDRQAIVLHHYVGFSTDEVGTVLGMTSGAVRMCLTRARRDVRRLLEAV